MSFKKIQYWLLAAGLLFLLISPSVVAQKNDIDTSAYLPYFYSGYPDPLDYNLIIASINNYPSEIRRLIRNGADVDFQTEEGATPLIFAVSNNNLEAVKALLEYDPDVNKATGSSETPLLIAAKNGNIEISEALIRDSALINYADRHGATPIHYASIYGYFYLVDMLIYYGAIIDSPANDGSTPLLAAVWAAYADIADILLQNGADPNAKDEEGFTPLHIAAQNGDTLLMDLLLTRDADLYSVNNNNYDALDLSIKSNHRDAAEFLLKKMQQHKQETPSKSVNPYLVAIKYMRKDIAAELEKYGIPKIYTPGFDQVAVSVSERFTWHDAFTGISVSLKEPLINGGIVAGCDLKFVYSRLLVKENQSLFYQYMDKRSLLYAGLFKEFKITDNPLKANWSYSFYLTAAYEFGNRLKGTEIIPPKKLRVIPAASLNWSKNSFIVYGGIDYMNSNYYKVGPLWFRLGVAYNIFFDKVRAPGRMIKWY